MATVKEVCDLWIEYAYNEWVEGWLRATGGTYLRESTRNMISRMKEASMQTERAEESWNLLERLKRLSEGFDNTEEAKERKYLYERSEVYMECALVAYRLSDLRESLNLLRVANDGSPRRSLYKAVGHWFIGCIQWQFPSRSDEAVLSWERSLQTLKEVEIDVSMNDIATANKCREVAKVMRSAIDESTRIGMPSSPPMASSASVQHLQSSAVRKKAKKKIQKPSEADLSTGFIEIDKEPKAESDRPCGPDRLNYSKYAQAFAKVILNHQTSTPITFGIYGQWGQGKSFLMGKIKDELADYRRKNKYSPTTFLKKYPPIFRGNLKAIIENYRKLSSEQRKQRKEQIDFHIVEFNAWAYVGTDHLWASLVTHLYREAEKYFGFKLHLARLWITAKKSLPKSLLIFSFYAALGAGISLLISFNEIRASWDSLKIAVNAFAGLIIGGSVVASLASLPTMLGTLKELSDNLILTRSKNLQNLAARPDFRAQIGLMSDIKEEIRFIGELLRKGKNNQPTRFILFIDDLDRCEHKKAIEVMQAIMLLLTDEDGAPFVIFMGIDARVIVRAIEDTYGEVLVKAGINGYEYLDKIVQVPFVIPGAPLSDIQRYVDSMLWSAEEKELIEKKKRLFMPADTPQAIGLNDTKEPVPQVDTPTLSPLEEISVTFTEYERNVIDQCSEYLIDNPRKIKRVINVYRFARLIIPPEQDRAKAIRWFLMIEQWPLHTAWIIEYIENFRKIKPGPKNKSIVEVYSLVKKNIHSKEMENLLTIDADPRKFEFYIRKDILTVQEILSLLPYTFNLNPAVRSEVSKCALKLEKI